MVNWVLTYWFINGLCFAMNWLIMAAEMVTAQQQVAEILRECIAEKIQRNSKYSARAFARDIQVSPAFVSMLLKGKKKLSLGRAKIVSYALEMPERKQKHFLRMVALSTLPAQSVSADEMSDILFARNSRKDILPLEADQLKFFTNWYNIAILDLTLCDNFKSDIGWIAERMQLSPIVVRDAVDRLLRLGLLKNEKGVLKKANQHINIPTDIPLSTIRNFHQQMIDKAKEALSATELGDFERRSISGITMAIDPRKMDEAKKRIEEFKNQMADLMTEGRCTEVYQLNIQFFPLTKASKGSG